MRLRINDILAMSRGFLGGKQWIKFANRVFSLTCMWPASMQIYWNKRKHLHKKRVHLHRIGLGHQHGRRFIVLGLQYGRRVVMWKYSIRVIAVEFVSSIKTRRRFYSHSKWTVRVSSSFTSLLHAERTSTVSYGRLIASK